MSGSRGGTGGPVPPEKSQKYRVSLQYWSESPAKSQSYQAAGGPMMAHFSSIWILSPLIKKLKLCRSGKTFWVHACSFRTYHPLGLQGTGKCLHSEVFNVYES